MTQHGNPDFMNVGQETNVAGLRVILVVRTERDSTPLLAALKPVSGVEVQVIKRSSWPVKNTFAAGRSANLLLVDSDLVDKEDLEFISTLKTSSEAEGCPIVVIAPRGSNAATLGAFRAGADDVLLKPIIPNEAREVFSRVTQHLGGASGPPSNVVVFAHVTGGAGATTCAVNAAAALGEANPSRGCCLLDLDIQFGSGATLLDLPYSSPVRELLEDPSRLDRLMFEGMLVKHSDSLHILTAPRLPLPLSGFKPSAVAELLRMAKSKFGNVVVDLPVAITSWTEVVLRAATMIYFVTPMNVPAAHRLSRMLSLLQQEELGRLPVKIVINRYNSASKGGIIALSQFEKAIGRHVDHLVPNDYGGIQQSHNQGQPAVSLKPDGKFSKAIQKMLTEDLGVAAATPSSLGFFLFRRS
jgi:pilus assembly protein CpaE